MKPRLPLFAKIIGWFFLNWLLLALVFALVFRAQFGWEQNWLLLGESGEHVDSVCREMLGEIDNHPPVDWNAILKRYRAACHVNFAVFDNDGPQLAGDPVTIPPEILAKMKAHGPEGDPGAPPGMAPPPSFLQGMEHRRLNMSMEHAKSAPKYWLMVRVPLVDRDSGATIRGTLFAISDSPTGDGFFFNFRPWLLLALGAVVFSVLFWLPIIIGITRSVLQMKKAAAQIAEGRFDVRVNDRRGDELGALGGAINRMAARLAGFVTGQKRFMGDVAHELCSPIARMQVAVGILEERAGEKDRKYVQSLREDVQEMSNLVNELLSFSKASLGAGAVKLQPMLIRPAVEKAVRREAAENPNVHIDIAGDLQAVADQELLTRAVCNLLRNAVRYAGESMITVSAHRHNGTVELIVADQGPGVPEAEIPKLFDPFYRVDTSRARETGGAGLGLSIVKTCVETCRGSVLCRNRKPAGFEVLVQLPAVA